MRHGLASHCVMNSHVKFGRLHREVDKGHSSAVLNAVKITLMH
jgi:hypothetical protein